MPLTRSGTLWNGGWAIETYFRGFHNWFKWGKDFRNDFRFGPVRLLHGTSYHGGEVCYKSRWLGNGGSILVYTPKKIPSCPEKYCHCQRRASVLEEVPE